MKYVLICLFLFGCASSKNPNSKIYDCMIELVERGVHAEISQSSCQKTFERRDGSVVTK